MKCNADNADNADVSFFEWASSSDNQIRYIKISVEEYTDSVESVEKVHVKPIKDTMKIRSVVADSSGCLRTRETTCICTDCFNETGFSDGSLCLWMKQKLTIIKPKTGDTEKNILFEKSM